MKNAIKIVKKQNGYALVSNGLLHATNSSGLCYRTAVNLPDGRYDSTALALHEAGHACAPAGACAGAHDPLPPVAHTLTVDADLLHRVALAMAMADRDIRYYLNGLCVQPGRIIATNGHRMHWATIEHDVPGEVIIPCELIAVLPKKGTVTLNFHERRIVSYSAWHMAAIDGKYPNIDRVIPKPSQACEQAWDGAGLAECVKYHKIDKSEFGACALRDGKVWAVRYDDVTRSDVEIANTGMTLINGYNATYLLDADKALKGAGMIVSEASECSLMVEGADINVVVMPMKL